MSLASFITPYYIHSFCRSTILDRFVLSSVTHCQVIPKANAISSLPLCFVFTRKPKTKLYNLCYHLCYVKTFFQLRVHAICYMQSWCGVYLMSHVQIYSLSHCDFASLSVFFNIFFCSYFLKHMIELALLIYAHMFTDTMINTRKMNINIQEKFGFKKHFFVFLVPQLSPLLCWGQ